MGRLLRGAGEEVAEEGGEACEAVGGIDVMLDDVEGEVVGAGEGPDGDEEQEGDFEGGGGEEDAGGGEEASEEEEEGFEVEELGGFDVHGEIITWGGGRDWKSEIRSSKFETGKDREGLL